MRNAGLEEAQAGVLTTGLPGKSLSQLFVLLFGCAGSLLLLVGFL